MCLSFCKLVSGRSRHFYDNFIFKLFLFRLFLVSAKILDDGKLSFNLVCWTVLFLLLLWCFFFSISKNKSPTFQSPLGDWLMKKERSKAENVLCRLLIWEKKKQRNKITQFAQNDLGWGHWLFRRLLSKQVIRLLIYESLKTTVSNRQGWPILYKCYQSMDICSIGLKDPNLNSKSAYTPWNPL